MPMSPQIISTSIKMWAIPCGVGGTEFPRLADALGTGLYESLMSPGVFMATLAGVCGPGVVSGAAPMGVLPQPMAASVSSMLAATGMAGVSVPSMSQAIASGFSQAILSATFTGMCPSVSTGAGVAKPVGLNFLLVQASLLKAATFYGISGADVTRLMCGIAQGLTAYLQAAMTIAVVSVGPPVPPPPVGPVPSMGVATLTMV